MNYSFRTRDLVLFLLIIQLACHLIIHWDQYNCDVYGNVQICVWIVIVLLRQLFQHSQYNKWALLMTLLIAGETVSINVIAVQQENCLQKPTFIFYCVIGYFLTISSFSKLLSLSKKPQIAKVIDSTTL
ncbi:unnamed protein product [Paramecium sonneborni]|uniref:Uncharacterized protein n=1 Tax=Paramecium sonneborni TaxID=65129 RepID=A0A8S1JVT1_9CILI|nr:unnamed protein product [Paramecium sonneborni]